MTSIFKVSRIVVGLNALLLISAAATLAQSSDESAVRGVVQQVFSQLQSHDYGSIYDSLPSSTRNRLSKPRFVSALQRAQDRYVLDRIDIGRVRISGDIAVADTQLFGRISQPFAAEGKIVVQQYLVREDGRWRVATGESSSLTSRAVGHPT